MALSSRSASARRPLPHVELIALPGVLVLLAACSHPPAELAGVDPAEIDYNWHVRPILSENCFKCHGPDGEGREASLRLDVREAAVGELPESPGRRAIAPGDPGRSEVMRRITASDPDDRMPPAAEHKTLTARDIAIVRAWIENGAEYKPHWAFIAPDRPAPPTGELDELARNDIDRFVLRRLEREGLRPSAEADRETLINRVSLTLTGLPPTLEQVDAFVADPRPDAYERVVDDLLASPRYAEHMAAYWLDLARWSETDGFLDDHHDRFLWPWRDWVIEAFSANMPFDRFATWQLAGDLLPDATTEQILATAFLRVGKRTTENGAIDEEYKAEYMVERTDNALGTAFLGLTVGCARCHDHRYDPISQRDYYSLGAFFNSNDEPGMYAPGFSAIQGGPTLPWADAAAAARIAAAQTRIAEREAAYRRAHRAAAARAADRAAALARGAPEVLAATIQSALDAGLAAYYPLDAAKPAALADLPPPRPPREPPPELVTLRDQPFGGPPETPPAAAETAEQRRQREQQTLLQRVPRTYNAEQLMLSASPLPGVPAAVLQSPIFRAGVRGQALFFDENNKGFLGRDVGWYERTQPFSLDFWFYGAEAYDKVPVINHRTEHNSGRNGYSLAIETGRLWVRLAHSPPADMIALESAVPFPVGEWTHVTLTYDASSRAAGTKVYLNGRPVEMRVERDSLTRSILPWGYGDVFDPFVGVAFGTRFREKAPVGAGLDEVRLFNRELTPVEVAFLHDGEAVLGAAEAWRDGIAQLVTARSGEVAAARDALTAAREEHNRLVTRVPQVLVMRDAPAPIPTHVLGRGVYSAPGERVMPRGLESVLAWDNAWPPNRLGLAEWLFDRRNPLTARVFVNRIWQMHFGRGLVETAEDFGSQGSIPTHPELLDWLAVDFIESGWDVQRLHRQIVLSATYRQRSAITEELSARDARNELLARGPRFRMTAEMVRDQALAVGGLLRGDVGGRSAMPYQPEGIWNPLNSFYRYPEPKAVPVDEHHRRTLYTFVKRNALHPALQIFDFPNRTESIARRRSSNTPLQALVLLNDPQFVEAYRALAERVLREEAEPAGRLVRLHRLATRRTPSAEELAVLSEYYAGRSEAFAGDLDKAARLIANGVSSADPSLPVADVAALTDVAALVMNSPDAYTVR